MLDTLPTDAERFPTLTAHGRAMLARLTEHPHAPIFRNRSGNRLTAEDIERVRAFETEVAGARVSWRPGTTPAWVAGHIAHCFASVPYYRTLGAVPARLCDIAPISRADLARDIARFVPDDAPVERLINFRTTGTSGHPLVIASHPVVAASYLAYHKRALRRAGIELQAGRGAVGVVLLGYQRECFTYASVTPTMGESGLVKINLHPNDWRDEQDRSRYLDDLSPEVYAGDPISYAALLELPIRSRPRAMLCTAMTLLPALRERLETRFACPVLDLYSLNEAGPIAVADATAGGHVLLQHRMFVEILNEAGEPVAPGARGEITLTGGFNFCLPLLRYRTGDYAALDLDGPEPVLVGLAGRLPLRFRTAKGAWINNIDVTHALRRCALPQFSVHQARDASIHVRHEGHAGVNEQIVAALSELFGTAIPVRVEAYPPTGEKRFQYTSDLAGAQP